MKEKNYDFRKRHWEVHRPNLRNRARLPQADELLLTSGWKIGHVGGVVTENAVKDFMDYLWVSMQLSVSRTSAQEAKTIWFSIDEAIDRGFILEVSEDKVCVKLSKDSEAFRASVYLEDIMSLEGAPVLPIGETVRKPLYDRREVHSGCGIDEFPDEELLATVHAGYDCIVLFVKGIDCTTMGYCNINDVIQRAKNFGVSVFLYNYIRSFIHPDDENAEKVFDENYGELFRRYPDAIGMGLCGESLEFPSKDPHTTGKVYSKSVTDGIWDPRPSPGWYPCEDYPRYLEKIRAAVHKVKPDAIIVFSTYNWAYETPENRRAFLQKLPKGYTLGICYELQAKRTLDGLRTPVMDYTISRDEPGEYFLEECGFAKECDIPICANTNTAGMAWDFGCVPYVPAPHKLLTRLRRLREAKEKFNVSAHYATHHFGWWNCVSSDLGKWASWEDFEPDYEALLEKIAIRDYGKDGAPHALEAWEKWEKAMNHYIATNEDQYGPWRVGAAYPFIFQPNITRTMSPKEIQFPTAPHAHFGHHIIKTLYQPYENINQAPGFLRYPKEIESLSKMEKLWLEGIAAADRITDTPEGEQLAALGHFILCSIRTTMNIKKWWTLNMKLQLSDSVETALSYLDQIESLAAEEVENVKSLFPWVECDSRLGWEASMEYVCDTWHLDWKLRQVESALREIKNYREIVENAYAK